MRAPRALTSSRLKTLDFHLIDAGHLALESSSEEIARLMREFLARHVTKH